MKVTLRKGLNVLGVRFGVELDTKDLPAAEAENLRRLLEAAQIESAGTPTSAVMPDLREVTISVETPDRHLEATFPEGQAPPAMDPLLDYLDRYEKVIPEE